MVRVENFDSQVRSPQEDLKIDDWSDLGQQLWSYLTGRGAAVNYTLVDMTVEVPRDIGPDAPRAIWKFDGTLRVTTSDDASAGSDPYRQ